MKCMTCKLGSRADNPLLTNGNITIHKNCDALPIAIRESERAMLSLKIIKDAIYYDWNRAYEFKDMHSEKAEKTGKLIGQCSNEIEDFLDSFEGDFEDIKQALEVINRALKTLPEREIDK